MGSVFFGQTTLHSRLGSEWGGAAISSHAGVSISVLLRKQT